MLHQAKKKAQIDKEWQQRRKEQEKNSKKHDKINKEQDHTGKVKGESKLISVCREKQECICVNRPNKAFRITAK